MPDLLTQDPDIASGPSAQARLSVFIYNRDGIYPSATAYDEAYDLAWRVDREASRGTTSAWTELLPAAIGPEQPEAIESKASDDLGYPGRSGCQLGPGGSKGRQRMLTSTFTSLGRLL